MLPTNTDFCTPAKYQMCWSWQDSNPHRSGGTGGQGRVCGPLAHHGERADPGGCTLKLKGIETGAPILLHGGSCPSEPPLPRWGSALVQRKCPIYRVTGELRAPAPFVCHCFQTLKSLLPGCPFFLGGGALTLSMAGPGVFGALHLTVLLPKGLWGSGPEVTGAHSVWGRRPPNFPEPWLSYRGDICWS